MQATTFRAFTPATKRARERSGNVSSWPILLQKSKVAGLRIFRENKKREAIADSYNLNHVTAVACEFKREAMRSPTSLHESRACSPQNF